MKGNSDNDKNNSNYNDNEENKEFSSIFFNGENEDEYNEFEKIVFQNPIFQNPISQQKTEDAMEQPQETQKAPDNSNIKPQNFQNVNQNPFDPYSPNQTNVQEPYLVVQDQTQYPMPMIGQENSETQSEPKIADVFTHRIEKNNTTSYLVRFENKSYRSKTWISNPTDPFSQHKIRLYLSRFGNSPPEPPYYPESYDIPSKIITHRQNGKDYEFLVLWKGLERKDATWETRETLQDDRLIQEYFTVPTDEETKNQDKSSFQFMGLQNYVQNKQGTGLSQLQSIFVNILAHRWYQNINALFYTQPNFNTLDMKIITCVFMNHLYMQYHQYGPFLIVTQINDIQSWENEIQNWTNLKFLTFSGSQSERDLILKYEIYYPSVPKLRFQVCITTAEYIRKTNTLKNLDWVCLIADQEVKLKPLPHQRFFSSMVDVKSQYRLALVNLYEVSIPELLSIRNFLKPNNPVSRNQFNSRYGNVAPNGQIMLLQNDINPYIINSLAYSQPETPQNPQLSPQTPQLTPQTPQINPQNSQLIPQNQQPQTTQLVEKVIHCIMTPIQFSSYKFIFMKNQELLTKAGSKNLISIHNICEDLKKVGSHPFLIENIRKTIFSEFNDTEDTELKLMMLSSGKLLVLDRLLKQFQNEPIPILLCYRITKLLNILRTFLECKGYPFHHVDPQTRNAQGFNGFAIYLIATPSIPKFLENNSMIFTRIILFDSDWKPQTDLMQITQKMQLSKIPGIHVFRLLTQYSFESILYDTIMSYVNQIKDKPKQGKSNKTISQQLDLFLKDPKELDQMLKMSASLLFQSPFPVIDEVIAKQITSNMIPSCQEIENSLQNIIEFVYEKTQARSNPFGSFDNPQSSSPLSSLPKVDDSHFWKNIFQKQQKVDKPKEIFFNRSFPMTDNSTISKNTSSSVLSPQMPSPPTLPQSPIQMQTSPPPLQQEPQVSKQKGKPRSKPKPKQKSQGQQSDASHSDLTPEQQYKRAISAWDKRQSTEVVSFMTKFGYSRLADFKSMTSNLDPSYFPEIGKLFIRWLVSASSLENGQFPLIDQVTSSPMSDFEDKFSKQKKDKIFSTVTQNAKAKIGKIHIAEFLHLIVSTSSSVDDIPVPEITSSFEVAYWNPPQDDQLLMQLTWERGLGDVTNDILFEKKRMTNSFPLDHNDVFILPFTPGDRIKTIINAFIKLFAAYSKQTKQEHIPINHNTCCLVVQQITKTDHNQIVHAMDNYDFTNLDDFVQKVNLHKHDDFVKDYVKSIVEESQRMTEEFKANNTIISPSNSILVSPISLAIAQKIIKQKELFEKLHEFIDKNSGYSDANIVIDIVFQWGFSTAITRPEVKHFLNTSQPQVKTLKQALKKLVIIDAPKKSSTTSHSSNGQPIITETTPPPLQQAVPKTSTATQQQFTVPQFTPTSPQSPKQSLQLSTANNPKKSTKPKPPPTPPSPPPKSLGPQKKKDDERQKSSKTKEKTIIISDESESEESDESPLEYSDEYSSEEKSPPPKRKTKIPPKKPEPTIDTKRIATQETTKLLPPIIPKKPEFNELRAPKPAPPKPKKQTKQTKETDETDENPELSAKLPYQISQSLVLVSLGHVVYDREAYHTERYAYCPGFISEKLFTSCLDPKERIWYRSLILDGGETPLFRVELKDNPEIYFEGVTPSNPWLAVRNEAENKKRELGLPAVKRVSCSGPEFYGLAVPTIANMIMKMKNIEKCSKLRRNNIDLDDYEDDIKPRRAHIQTTPLSPPDLKRDKKKIKKQQTSDYYESGNSSSSSYENYISESNTISEGLYSDYDSQYSDTKPETKKQEKPSTQNKPIKTEQKKETKEDDKEYYDYDYDYYYSYYSDYDYSYSSDESDDEIDIPDDSLILKFDFKKLLDNPPKPEIFITLPMETTEELYNTLEK